MQVIKISNFFVIKLIVVIIKVLNNVYKKNINMICNIFM